MKFLLYFKNNILASWWCIEVTAEVELLNVSQLKNVLKFLNLSMNWFWFSGMSQNTGTYKKIG